MVVVTDIRTSRKLCDQPFIQLTVFIVFNRFHTCLAFTEPGFMDPALDEYAVAKSLNTQNKVKKAYARFDLLIIDEWLLRPLPESEAYDLLELIDACSQKGALILCTQYDVDDWYYRIDCDRAEDEGSAVAEGILDRIINNKYSIEVKGRISMRKRHAFSDEGSGVNDNGR